jgi:dihydrofolate reductase
VTPAVVFAMSVSLDGYIAGPGGDISWSPPDEELHRFHNERVRGAGVQLMGRRLYETMLPWETGDLASAGPAEAEFAEIWQPLPKIVFSTTLERVEGNARLATRELHEEIAALRETADGEIAIGGAGLASSAIAAGLVDEFHLFVCPVVLGAGTPYFPPLERPLNLELAETRTFGSRVVFLRYRREC